MRLSTLRPLLAAAMLAAASAQPAHAGIDPLLGEMMLVGGNFCPVNWLPANGALLSIAQNSALYSLLGTTYGGDGQTTFGLPDLRGRVPLGVGQGPGLSYMGQGQMGGTESVTLMSSQMPAHTHQLAASTAPATHAAPAAGRLPAQAQNAGVYHDAGGATVALTATDVAGASQPFTVRNPYLGMTWCIAISGVYPSSN